MKNHFLKSIKVILSVTMLAAMPACKKTTVATIPPDEVEVIVPCSGSAYFSSGEIFRANSLGESKDQVIARKRAMSNARADLAAQVATTVKAVTDNYVNTREYNNKEEVEERFENLSREVVNQELKGSKIICEKQTRTNTGSYKSYVAMEVDPNAIISAFDQRLSKDERLKIDYDYEKFKQTFESEMNKMGR